MKERKYDQQGAEIKSSGYLKADNGTDQIIIPPNWISTFKSAEHLATIYVYVHTHIFLIMLNIYKVHSLYMLDAHHREKMAGEKKKKLKSI